MVLAGVGAARAGGADTTIAVATAEVKAVMAASDCLPSNRFRVTVCILQAPFFKVLIRRWRQVMVRRVGQSRHSCGLVRGARLPGWWRSPLSPDEYGRIASGSLRLGVAKRRKSGHGSLRAGPEIATQPR